MFKAFIKLGLVAAALAVASVSFADTQNTQINIPVGDGIVQPGKVYSVDLSSIPPGVSYSITCTLNSAYDTVMSFKLNSVDVSLGDIIDAYINADGQKARGLTPFLVYGANGEVFPGGNTVFVESVRFTQSAFTGYKPTFDFTNLDQKNAVTIKECFAKPANVNLMK